MTLGEARDKVLRLMQKGSLEYRSGYVDGVLDMFNLLDKENRNADEITSSEGIPLGKAS